MPAFNKELDFSKVLIRPARIEDAASIVDAERAIAKEPGIFCSEPSELKIENVVETITSAMDGKAIYIVAESNGKLIGHAFLEFQSLKSLRHVADLNIAVYQGWQRKGIGAKLLQEIIQLAKKSEIIEKIQLNVRASNLGAISLYKKMGFKEEGRLKNRVKVNHNYIDDIVMGMDLNLPTFSDNISIRLLEKGDIQILISNFCFNWSSHEATANKWNYYLKEHLEKTRAVFVLEYEKAIIGYGSLLYFSKYPYFKKAKIPEINDVWIAKDHRHKGFGKMLIQKIENFAAIEGYKTLGIGVGLYADYGIAQKLYFRLGYEPDGKGVTYNYQTVVPGKSYPLDDELILWLTKEIRSV